VRPLAALLALLLIAAAPAPLLREEVWLAPGASLTTAPAECLAHTNPQVEAGRALFRAPVLFGGPAARVGLSCEACHAGGGANAHFFLPELTDRPGAADVTSAWASKLRGDGVHNPAHIPDLMGVDAKRGFGPARTQTLEAFIGGVIVEEFQGPPPPPGAVESLAAYLRARAPQACEGPRPMTLAMAAQDVRRALEAAQGDLTSLLLYAAQDNVARIVERLPEAQFAGERRDFTLLAAELGALRGARAQAGWQEARAGWMARFDALVRRTARRERATYFHAATLERAR
jgi:hypothetical protein